jgi:AAA domain (dynein-related subfamily)
MDVMEQVELCIEANVPPLVMGKPGVGKTARLTQLAEAKGAHIEVIIASLRDPTDFGGLPIRTEEGVRLLAPQWAIEADRIAREGRAAWIFLDEITTAPPAVQAALLRFMNERQLGELRLHHMVRVIAAANPPDEAAGGWSLEAPLANRLAHFNLLANAEQWAEGMITGFPLPRVRSLPDNWEIGVPIMRSKIASFIRRRGNLLIDMPQDDEKRAGPWPSPRTWDFGTRLMAAAEALGEDNDEQLGMLASCVGNGAATEFVSWLTALDLPDPEELLANPENLKIEKDRPDRTHAMLAGVVSAMAGQPTSDRYLQCWKVLAQAAKLETADIAVGLVATVRKIGRVLMDQGEILPEVSEYVKPFMPMLAKAGYTT